MSAPRKRGLGQGKGSQSAHESGVQTKRAVKLAPADWQRFDRLPGKGNSDRVRWALSMLETFGVLPE